MSVAALQPINRTSHFLWLLKREFWEHRGSFVWAQLITGAVAVLFAALGVVLSVLTLRRNWVGSERLHIDDMQNYLRTLGAIGDGLLLTGMLLSAAVLAIVVFFYALGCLYDDRRDRSLLFWKSLPLSDTQTVLSKATWALLLAPLISIAIGLIVGLALWLLAIVGGYAAGAPNAWAMALQSHPFQLLGSMLVTVPMGLLWSLPTVGWLMFCSAWARSKPFLWAALLPLLACVMINIVGAMPGVSLPVRWIWYVLVYRGLMSTVPGTWAPMTLNYQPSFSLAAHPDDLLHWVLQHNAPRQFYASFDTWIGAVIGIAFIAAAIYLRRRSGEN